MVECVTAVSKVSAAAAAVTAAVLAVGGVEKRMEFDCILCLHALSLLLLFFSLLLQLHLQALV